MNDTGSANTPAPVHVKKVSQIIADELQSQIVLGQLKEGDALPSEAALMEQFGVSRATLREAIRILEAGDLVRTARGGRGGAKVRHPTAERAATIAGMVLQLRGARIRDVMHMRSIILPEAAFLAADKAGKSDLSALRRCLDQVLEPHDDMQKLYLAGQDFDMAIVELAGSETMTLICQMLGHITRQNVSRVPVSVKDLPAGVAQSMTFSQVRNRMLVELIEQGEAEGARALMHKRMVIEERAWSKGLASHERVRLIA